MSRFVRQLLAVATARAVRAACSPAPPPRPRRPSCATKGWAGQVTFPELAEDLGYLAPVKLKWVGNTISGPQDIQTVRHPATSTSAVPSTARWPS